MTRSLAENYPYSRFYKAKIRGSKTSWVKITDWLESGEMNAEKSLEYCISGLIKTSIRFHAKADRLMDVIEEKKKTMRRTCTPILRIAPNKCQENALSIFYHAALMKTSSTLQNENHGPQCASRLMDSSGWRPIKTGGMTVAQTLRGRRPGGSLCASCARLAG